MSGQRDRVRRFEDRLQRLAKPDVLRMDVPFAAVLRQRTAGLRRGRPHAGLRLEALRLAERRHGAVQARALHQGARRLVQPVARRAVLQREAQRLEALRLAERPRAVHRPDARVVAQRRAQATVSRAVLRQEERQRAAPRKAAPVVERQRAVPRKAAPVVERQRAVPRKAAPVAAQRRAQAAASRAVLRLEERRRAAVPLAVHRRVVQQLALPTAGPVVHQREERPHEVAQVAALRGDQPATSHQGQRGFNRKGLRPIVRPGLRRIVSA